MLSRLTRLRPAWVLVGLVLLAAALRLWRLDVLPPGLFFDEAYNGVDARRVLTGVARPLFFPANNGREPLFIYLQALSVAILGATPYALRIVSALTGILSIPAIYYCAYSILQPAVPSEREVNAAAWLALVAAAGAVISYWHLSLSRLGLRAGLLIPFSALAIAFFWRAWTDRGRLNYVWAGVCLALSMYTYIAARLLPLVIAVFVIVELAADLWRGRRLRQPFRREWRGRILGLAILTGVVCLGILPLAWTLLHDPTLVSARAADVSIWTASDPGLSESPLSRLVENVIKTARAFYDRGDQNLRHNLSGRPVNDLLLAILFTLGWLSALWRISEPRARLLLIWFAVMLLPTVLSIAAPHYLRSVGAFLPLTIFYACGADVLGRMISRLMAQRRIALEAGQVRLITIMATLLLVLVASGAWTSFDYFWRWARSPKLGGMFDVQYQLVAQEAASRLTDESASVLLMSNELYMQPQMGFALGDIANSRRLPPEKSPLLLLQETGADPPPSSVAVWRDKSRLVSAWLQPTIPQDDRTSVTARELRWPGGQPEWPRLQMIPLPGKADLELRKIRYSLHVDFANGLQLVGYDVAPDMIDDADLQNPFRLILFWDEHAPGDTAPDATKAMGTGDFDVFSHLSAGGSVWQTANGSLHSVDLVPWLQEGRPLEDVRKLPVPPSAPEGKAHFEVGLYLYHPETEGHPVDRIEIVNDAGQPVADRVDLGAVMIGASPPSADSSDLRRLEVEFDGRIALEGWRTAQGLADPNMLLVDLGWHALDRSITDYAAFVHLVDSQGRIISQQDQPPGGADNPTHLWAPGETVRNTFSLRLPSEVSDDRLFLRIGLYEPVSGQRLPVTGAAELPSAGTRADTFVLLPMPERELIERLDKRRTKAAVWHAQKRDRIVRPSFGSSMR